MHKIIRKIRIDVGNFLQHFTWALGGTGCDCGDNPFNGFADWMDKRVNADDQWNEEGEAIGRWSRAIDKPYDWMQRLANWVDPE